MVHLPPILTMGRIRWIMIILVMITRSRISVAESPSNNIPPPLPDLPPLPPLDEEGYEDFTLPSDYYYEGYKDLPPLPPPPVAPQPHPPPQAAPTTPLTKPGQTTTTTRTHHQFHQQHQRHHNSKPKERQAVNVKTWRQDQITGLVHEELH